jgi:hypothetical protein
VGLAATLGPRALAPRALVVAATLDPLDLGQDVKPICLRSGCLTQVSLVRRCCKFQGTWVCAPVTPKQLESGAPFQPQVFLVLEGDARPKLIIIIIIDFTLKIKSIFFFSIVIIFIVNLIILIIIFNLSAQVLIFFNRFLKNMLFFFDGNNIFFSIY